MKTMTPADLAAAMGTTHRRAVSRLCALGYTEVCGRCGGSGRYSWNQIDGDRCFGCGGSGKRLARITADVVAEALARIQAGALDGYFAEAKAAREIKSAVAKTQAAWHATFISRNYSVRAEGMTSAEFVAGPHYRAAVLINKIMERAWDQESPFRRAATALERLAIVTQAREMILAIDAAFVAFSS